MITVHGLYLLTFGWNIESTSMTASTKGTDIVSPVRSITTLSIVFLVEVNAFATNSSAFMKSSVSGITGSSSSILTESKIPAGGDGGVVLDFFGSLSVH